MNRVDLSVTAHEVKPLRYTPAGLPVVELLLQYAGEVLEAGQARQVNFSLTALALGELAHFLADTPLGAGLKLQGFLAAARKGSSKLILHIQHAERLHGGAAVV